MADRSAGQLVEDDLVIEPWGHGDPMMDGSVRNQRGVQITHKPTGVTGESDYNKSQLANRVEALVLLRHRLACQESRDA